MHIQWIKLLLLQILLNTVSGYIAQQTKFPFVNERQVLVNSYKNGTSVVEPNQNQKNPFIEWLAGLIGATTTQKPTIELTPPEDCPPCVCGKTNKKNRIVGGEETEVNQYPWMAMLQYSNQFYCGGSLINDRYVLTAAHCVNGFNPSKIKVVLLEHDRSSETESSIVVMHIERVVKHGGYSSTNYNNDIALLRLNGTVEMKDGLRPVCMPSPKKSFTGYNGIVTGWGATSEQGQVSINLQEVTVPILSNTECKKSGYGMSRITENMLCAGLKEGKKDSCQGDSGGPLHIFSNTTMIHQIVGVVSWGEGCAKPNYPGVYTRVNRYGTWIRTNTKDACFCNEEVK